MITIKNISKEYKDKSGFKTVLLKNISFTISSGEINSLIAPYGSGKSTLLKIISGLEQQSGGEIINSTGQKIIFIPTEPSSFPWFSVRKNISLGLSKIDEAEISRLIGLVGLEGYENYYPQNNSYGFRFRISLARSLAHKPGVILLDEPFNQMDIQTKKEIYLLIRNINATKKTTFILATTNITEALFLSNKIFLMKKKPGEIISEIDVDLSNDRSESIIDTEKFVQQRAQIENSFKKIKSQKLFNISI